MPFLRKYGTGTGADVIVPLIKAGAVDHAVSADYTPSAGDVKVSKDGGAAANITTLPTYITSIGWKFVFSDAELQAARINVQVTDSATKAVEDQHFVIETYGNASAQHAFDLDTASHTTITTIASDLVIVASDLLQVYSDTTIIASDVVQVYSDTTITSSKAVQIYSDTAIIYSDTTAIHSDTTIIASDVVIIGSDVVQVYSDTTIIASDVAAMWTTALTEAYRSTGSTGTAAQLLYEILAHLGEFAISGTQKTTKKLDGTTTAKVYDLNSSTAPTSISENT